MVCPVSLRGSALKMEKFQHSWGAIFHLSVISTSHKLRENLKNNIPIWMIAKLSILPHIPLDNYALYVPVHLPNTPIQFPNLGAHKPHYTHTHPGLPDESVTLEKIQAKTKQNQNLMNLHMSDSIIPVSLRVC